MTFKLKRVYEAASARDGARVLVDRLWPRGVSKAKAGLAFWMKDVAPSPALRVWFDHDPEKFTEFGRRYRKEIQGNPAVAELRKLGQRKVVTLLYGAHDPAINHAVVLRAALLRRSAAKRAPKK